MGADLGVEAKFKKPENFNDALRENFHRETIKAAIGALAGWYWLKRVKEGNNIAAAAIMNLKHDALTKIDKLDPKFFEGQQSYIQVLEGQFSEFSKTFDQ